MAKTLITASTVVTMNDRRDVLKPGYVGIDGSRIAHVGNDRPIGGDWADAPAIDGDGCIAIPGLINAHTHAGMTMMRGVSDDLPLREWLETVIWPMESRLTGDDVYWGTKLGVLEMIRSGITCIHDMYWHSEQVAEACNDLGMRAAVSCALVGIRDDAEEQLQQALDLFARWDGDDANELIKLSLGPHALYTCPPAFLERVVGLAGDLNANIHIHIAETEQEVRDCKAEHGGRSPVEVLGDAGVFEHPTVAAHCIHLSDTDIEALSTHAVTAVHCPSSNMKLGSGVMGVEKLTRSGVNVALGTDGAASNNNLSILNEMRIAALLAKVTEQDPSALPASMALEMATRNGAKALGIEHRVGQLHAGYDADIVLLRNDGVNSLPTADPVSTLCYSLYAEDVDTVLIGGRTVLSSGQFVDVDVDEVIARATEVIGRIRS